MTKGKKKKTIKETPEKKNNVVKVGGLWVDSSSFPSFDDEKEEDPPPHQG